jgi:hypothetical protein
MIESFFKELKESSMRVQYGVAVLLFIILVLTVVSLVQCAYISGEDARIQEQIESVGE